MGVNIHIEGDSSKPIVCHVFVCDNCEKVITPDQLRGAGYIFKRELKLSEVGNLIPLFICHKGACMETLDALYSKDGHYLPWHELKYLLSELTDYYAEKNL